MLYLHYALRILQLGFSFPGFKEQNNKTVVVESDVNLKALISSLTQIPSAQSQLAVLSDLSKLWYWWRLLYHWQLSIELWLPLLVFFHYTTLSQCSWHFRLDNCWVEDCSVDYGMFVDILDFMHCMHASPSPWQSCSLQNCLQILPDCLKESNMPFQLTLPEIMGSGSAPTPALRPVSLTVADTYSRVM